MSAVTANPVNTIKKFAITAAGVLAIVAVSRRLPVVGPYVDKAVKFALA